NRVFFITKRARSPARPEPRRAPTASLVTLPSRLRSPPFAKFLRAGPPARGAQRPPASSSGSLRPAALRGSFNYTGSRRERPYWGRLPRRCWERESESAALTPSCTRQADDLRTGRAPSFRQRAVRLTAPTGASRVRSTESAIHSGAILRARGRLLPCSAEH